MGMPRKLKNFALFVDGLNYMGEVPEVTLPKLTRKMEEHRSGGMNGPVKTDLGMELMEMEWTAAGYMRAIYEQWGAAKHDAVLLRFAGALQADDDDAVQALEVVARGRHEEIDPGSAKAGDATEFKVKTALSYYKLSIDGAVLVEIDFVNMVEIVGGVDRLADIKAALGV